MTMTLEQVRDWHRHEAYAATEATLFSEHQAMADAIDAHLLSQEAEIERLSQESAQQFIRARDWAELSGKNEDRASLAESRLAAADALLRDMRDGAFNIGGWADAIDEYFQEHLQGSGDEATD